MCVIVVVVIVVAFIVYTKKRRKKLFFLQQRYGRDNDGFSNYYDLHRTDFHTLTSPPVVADSWEIPHSALKLGQVLGSGAFGMVVKGQITREMLRHRGVELPRSDRPDNFHVAVAVKMLQEGVDTRYYRDFIKEINLMKDIGYHGNVVSMLGCCTLREPICLVVEHMAMGDLLQYLKKIRHLIYSEEQGDSYYENRGAEHLTPLNLLCFARQIVKGMEFLSSKFFVHRDLAARNILVDENKVLKIGDFGLTRYIYDDKVYVNRRGGKLPIKWMSIEAIFDQTFSTASDVWSFGIVLFELMTLGGTPYPGVANRELLQELRNGYRMECPNNCSTEMYQLMRDCWQANPKDRPSFTDIGLRIDSMIADCSGQDYLDLEVDVTRGYYQAEASEDEDEDSVMVSDTPGDSDVEYDEGPKKDVSPYLEAVEMSDDEHVGSSRKDVDEYDIPICSSDLEDIEDDISVHTNLDEVLDRFKRSENMGEVQLDTLNLSTEDTASKKLENTETRSPEGTPEVPVDETTEPSHEASPASTENIGRFRRSRCIRSKRGRHSLVRQPLKSSHGEPESDSSYSQLEGGSDDVFPVDLYSHSYNYLESPASSSGGPSGSDSSPTDSDLSDYFFQTDSSGITYCRRRSRIMSTTSTDSGLPQSPFQDNPSGGFPEHFFKNRIRTNPKAKLRRMSRNRTFTPSVPSLPAVHNSDEDLTSSSL